MRPTENEIHDAGDAAEKGDKKDLRDLIYKMNRDLSPTQVERMVSSTQVRKTTSLVLEWFDY